VPISPAQTSLALWH